MVPQWGGVYQGNKIISNIPLVARETRLEKKICLTLGLNCFVFALKWPFVFSVRSFRYDLPLQVHLSRRFKGCIEIYCVSS